MLDVCVEAGASEKNKAKKGEKGRKNIMMEREKLRIWDLG